MAVTEGLKPLDPNSQVPSDPNVHIPDHVKRASEAAEARHKELYTPELDPQVHQPVEPQIQQQVEPQVQQQVGPQVNTQNSPQQVQNPTQINPGDDFTGPADQQSLKDSEWARRYNSMHGRWQAAERSRAAMEQTMGELGQELVRTQHLLSSQAQDQPISNVKSQSNNKNLITDEDVQNYGTELIDMARRAAMDTVAPEIEALRAENARLTSQVTTTSKRELFMTLDRQMPTWRQINTDQRFIAWLNLRNVYTGQVRKEMLNKAVNGAQAPQVLQMFKDFLSEAQATGHVPQNQPTEQLKSAPYQPAVDLATLAAPGKARPAQGDAQVPADKPIYTHAQISNYYSEKRRGLWANRLADWDKLEADFIAAGREGRVR
jgi:hypothetical protein